MQAIEELDWQPEFGLLDGLRDSYEKDFGRGTYRKEPDFTPGEGDHSPPPSRACRALPRWAAPTTHAGKNPVRAETLGPGVYTAALVMGRQRTGWLPEPRARSDMSCPTRCRPGPADDMILSKVKGRAFA